MKSINITKGISKEIRWKRVMLKKTIASIEYVEKIFNVVLLNFKRLAPRFPWVSNIIEKKDMLDYLQEIEEKQKKWKRINYSIFLWDEYLWQIFALNIKEKNKSLNVWYWLSEKFKGKGYMKEAFLLFEKEIFVNLGINRIQIQCNEENLHSKYFIEKRDYVFEWKLRKNVYSSYLKKFTNTLVFSKLSVEYFSNDKK